MKAARFIGWTLALAALCLSCPGVAAPAEPVCAPSLLQNIPVRPAGASGGSQFAAQIRSSDGTPREAAIAAEILAGNVPGFLRRLIPVTTTATIDGRPVRVTACVLPDYLAVGSDRDFLFVPMRLATALEIGNRYGFTLPTAKLVDAIYAASEIHLGPQPLPASDLMRSTDYYRTHNDLILTQESGLGVRPGPLTAGHKKDLVLTNRLWTYPDRVAIYGWHKPDDRPIQPLSTVHGARYADYSHGVRLVSTTVYVNGAPRSIFAALSDPKLAQALSGEGPIRAARDLVAARAVQPPEAVAATR